MRNLRIVRTAFAGLIAGLAVLFTSAEAGAHWVADNTILLEPYDPVPQIQFRHRDGGDCDHDCWADRHCGYDCRVSFGYGQGCADDCGHRHRDRGCDDWRDRDHFAWHRAPCGDELVEGYLARARRSDDQSDQWNHAMDHWNADMDWYDHAVVGDHDHDRDHDHDHDRH